MIIKEIYSNEIKDYDSTIIEIYCEAMNYSKEKGQLLSGRLLQNNTRIWIAQEDEKIVGFLFGKNFKKDNWWAKQINNYLPQDIDWYQHTFEINELMVLPNHQSKGIGRELLRHLHSNTDYEIYLLGTSKYQNERIIGFYESLGYRTIIETFYYEGSTNPATILGLLR